MTLFESGGLSCSASKLAKTDARTVRSSESMPVCVK